MKIGTRVAWYGNRGALPKRVGHVVANDHGITSIRWDEKNDPLLAQYSNLTQREVESAKAERFLVVFSEPQYVMTRKDSQMSRIYRCTKTIISDFQGGTVVFTKGRLYEGLTSATPGGEWAMQFTNDLNEPHLITADWLHGYFARVEEALKGADREAERDEEEESPPGVSLCLDRDYMLAREEDEPYEPDYWGAHYE